MNNDKYIKEVENQNYDLIKKVAELQEILEDYNKILSHNDEWHQTVVIRLINELFYKTVTIHNYKILLEENDIPHDYEDIQIYDKVSREVSCNYLHDLLSSYNGIKDDIFPGDSFDLYMKYVYIHLLKDNNEYF